MTQEMTLSEAASILKSKQASVEQRSIAASILGKKGGSMSRGRRKSTVVSENHERN